jgi:rRNA maturation protein Nop10
MEACENNNHYTLETCENDGSLWELCPLHHGCLWET